MWANSTNAHKHACTHVLTYARLLACSRACLLACSHCPPARSLAGSHARPPARSHDRLHACSLVHSLAHLYACAHMHACMHDHVRTHTCTHARMRILTCTCTDALTHTRMSACRMWTSGAIVSTWDVIAVVMWCVITCVCTRASRAYMQARPPACMYARAHTRPRTHG